MGTIEARIEAVELFGKDHHIPIIRFGDEGDSLHLTKVLRLGQCDSDSIARVGAVGDDVPSVEGSHARILDTELLILGKRTFLRRSQKGLGVGDEPITVVTSRQPDNRPAGSKMRPKKHDVFAVELHHPSVVNGFDKVRYVALGEDRILAIPPDNLRFHDDFLASRSKIAA